MRNVFALSVILTIATFQINFAQSISTFINEVYYIANNPAEKGVEIAGQAGTNLVGYEIVVYALDGTVAYTEYISAGIIPNKQNGYGTIWYEVDQTGNGGGLALVSPNGAVVQFISYGTINFANVIITAVGGPANGLTSQYIGTQLITSNSLQLIGTGLTYLDFVWNVASDVSEGDVNDNQLFNGAQSYVAPVGGTQNEIKEGFEVSTFPNPVVESLQIQFATELKEEAVIELFDISGRMISQKIIEEGNISTKLDVTSQNPGRYVLNIRTNNTSKSQLIVKQ